MGCRWTLLISKSEVCRRWAQFFEGSISVREAKNADITTRPGM